MKFFGRKTSRVKNSVEFGSEHYWRTTKGRRVAATIVMIVGAAMFTTGYVIEFAGFQWGRFAGQIIRFIGFVAFMTGLAQFADA